MSKLLFVLLLMLPTTIQAKRLALTFDDSPRHAKGLFDGPTRAKKFIENMKANKVGPVVFFSNSKKLDDEGKARMMAYTKAGHIIANHTHTHPRFNDVSLKDYRADFIRGHAILSKLPNYKKWFRFPYLKEGDTPKKRDGMRRTLKAMGYQNAYVTLNNSDWYFEDTFQKTLKQHPNLDLKKVGEFYVNNLIDNIEYYDKMAVKHLKRSPAHILLLHEMDISALYIGDLVKALRKNGWKIISLEEALKDEIAKYETKTIHKSNPGRIGEIAYDKGQKEGLWPVSMHYKTIKEGFAKVVKQSKKLR